MLGESHLIFDYIQNSYRIGLNCVAVAVDGVGFGGTKSSGFCCGFACASNAICIFVKERASHIGVCDEVVTKAEISTNVRGNVLIFDYKQNSNGIGLHRRTISIDG